MYTDISTLYYNRLSPALTRQCDTLLDYSTMSSAFTPDLGTGTVFYRKPTASNLALWLLNFWPV